MLMTAINSNRKLVYGIGINDAEYTVYPTINGKRTPCHFYSKWTNLLMRCYSAKCQAKQPAYIGCSVCEEWHSFTAFKSWMMKQDWEGKELDKDLIIPGNKIYSPENCLFVTKAINLLLTDHAASRGLYPQGVIWNVYHEKYQAYVCKYGKIYHLGYFSAAAEAEEAYWEEKIDHVARVAMQQSGRVKKALINWVNMKIEVHS